MTGATMMSIGSDSADQRSRRQPVLMGVCGRSRSRRHVELDEDVAQMSLDRLLAQHQCTCDAGVAPPFGHQPQHLYLTLRETGGAGSSMQLVDLLDCRRRTQPGKGPAGDGKLCGRRVFVTHLTQCTREDNPRPRSLVR